MISEEEFKNNLNSKLNQKQFEFTDADWQNARAVLDQSTEYKNRFAFLYSTLRGLLLIMPLVCSFALIYFSYFDLQELNTNKIVSYNTEITPLADTVTINNFNNYNNKQLALKTKTVTTIPNKKNINATKNPTILKTPSNNLQTQSVTNKLISRSNNVGKITSSNFLTVKPKFSFTKVNEINNNKGNNDVTQIDYYANYSETKTAIKTSTTEEEEEQQQQQQQLVTEILPQLPFSTLETDFNYNDIIVSSLLADTNKPKPFVKRPIPTVSFEAGASYLFGWQNAGKTDANGFNPIIGLNYLTQLSKKLTVSVGVQYTSIKNLLLSSHEVKQLRYNFSEESDIMKFTPSTLHYVYAPIKLGYLLTTKSTIGLGCNVGYLLNASGNVEIYSQRNNQKTNPTTLKTYGYTQGFSKYDTQLSVFYNRKLYKNLYFNVEFFYGLNDIKNNAFFNTNAVEKNRGFKATILYNFFKK
jgi:hypothetical protein